MYASQLEFLRDTVTHKKPVNALERSSAGESTKVKVERDENDAVGSGGGGGDGHENTSTPFAVVQSTTVTKVKRTSGGKKRTNNTVDEKILAMDSCEKKTKIDSSPKEKNDDNDNRHFLLSLVDSLSSLPRKLNTSCRIEMLQCINKYEQLHQQPLLPPANESAAETTNRRVCSRIPPCVPSSGRRAGTNRCVCQRS